MRRDSAGAVLRLARAPTTSACCPGRRTAHRAGRTPARRDHSVRVLAVPRWPASTRTPRPPRPRPGATVSGPHAVTRRSPH